MGNCLSAFPLKGEASKAPKPPTAKELRDQEQARATKDGQQSRQAVRAKLGSPAALSNPALGIFAQHLGPTPCGDHEDDDHNSAEHRDSVGSLDTFSPFIIHGMEMGEHSEYSSTADFSARTTPSECPPTPQYLPTGSKVELPTRPPPRSAAGRTGKVFTALDLAVAQTAARTAAYQIKDDGSASSQDMMSLGQSQPLDKCAAAASSINPSSMGRLIEAASSGMKHFDECSTFTFGSSERCSPPACYSVPTCSAPLPASRGFQLPADLPADLAAILNSSASAGKTQSAGAKLKNMLQAWVPVTKPTSAPSSQRNSRNSNTVATRKELMAGSSRSTHSRSRRRSGQSDAAGSHFLLQKPIGNLASHRSSEEWWTKLLQSDGYNKAVARGAAARKPGSTPTYMSAAMLIMDQLDTGVSEFGEDRPSDLSDGRGVSGRLPQQLSTPHNLHAGALTEPPLRQVTRRARRETTSTPNGLIAAGLQPRSEQSARGRSFRESTWQPPTGATTTDVHEQVALAYFSPKPTPSMPRSRSLNP